MEFVVIADICLKRFITSNCSRVTNTVVVNSLYTVAALTLTCVW